MQQKIGKMEVRKFTGILQKYKQGKANLEARIVENEQWYKMRHWEYMRKKYNEKNPDSPEPASAWLFNSIINKHADAMDNYPQPNVLPREESDKESAEQLSAIMPVILEQNDYEQIYSDAWWYKLKTGTAVYGVFWNAGKENGLGDVEISNCDILNLFWEPGIRNIQDSRYVFYVSLVDNEILEEQYSQTKGKLGSASIEVTKYIHDDSIDTSEKSLVVDCYYKANGVLHYCKYVNEIILFATENEREYRTAGLYAHGKYPFVFDTMFIEPDTPAGFGYIDIMKDCQMYIDKLQQAILRNTLMCSRKRYFYKNNGAVNKEEFADWNNDFVNVEGNLDEESIREIQVTPISNAAFSALQQKIDELKETSGNRDFSQGSTASGVTAASAIAALQEAGSKLSRDMIKSSYRAHAQTCYFVLELVRQFYTQPRCFRITGEGSKREFVEFNNSALQPQQADAFGIDLGARKPVFDIEIVAQKKSPFSTLARNELAKELYGMQFFNPQMADQALLALDMMDIEGKDGLIQKISQNGTMYQQLQQMQEQMNRMLQLLGANGMDMPAPQAPPGNEGGQEVSVNPLGGEIGSHPAPEKAAQQAEEAGNPK